MCPTILVNYLNKETVNILTYTLSLVHNPGMCTLTGDCSSPSEQTQLLTSPIITRTLVVLVFCKVTCKLHCVGYYQTLTLGGV